MARSMAVAVLIASRVDRRVRSLYACRSVQGMTGGPLHSCRGTDGKAVSRYGLDQRARDTHVSNGLCAWPGEWGKPVETGCRELSGRGSLDRH